MPLEQKIQADANTGLLTKYQFEKAVKAALVRVDGEFPNGAMLIFGIDNFKIINESFNRRFGDMLLRIAADAISNVLPEGVMLLLGQLGIHLRETRFVHFFVAGDAIVHHLLIHTQLGNILLDILILHQCQSETCQKRTDDKRQQSP